MAAAIILPLASSILKTIASFTGDCLSEEIKGFKSAKEDLKVIAEDLESIKGVLQDAEAKQYSNAAVKIWLRDLKSVVYDIDDLLDEVATDSLRRRVNKGQFVPQLRYYLTLKPLILRFDLSDKIKDLRLELHHIVVNKNKIGLTDRPLEAPSVKRDVFDVNRYVNNLAIVGREEAKNDIINIVLGLGDERSLSVLPILGMGGIGKTTVARLVYREVDQFNIKSWVRVSDKFDLQNILQGIVKDVTHDEYTLLYSLEQLVERLQEALKGKKYFLALDDVWEDDIRLWMELKSILSVGGRGSVILITTRIEKVASITQTVKPYHLDKLPNSVCWNIFKKLAFADSEEERYPCLREIGKSIVEKCHGIPLVVQCLGNLLQSERGEKEWMRINNNMDNLNQLDGQYDMIKRLLKLSHDKLPFHLKLAFAHLSLFGKDCAYSPEFCFHFSNALGFSQLCDGSYSVHNFINELLSRSIFHDVEWSFDYTINTFKMHDLLHDLASDILGEELAVVNANKLSVANFPCYIAWGVGLFSRKKFPEEINGKKARAFVFRFPMKYVSYSFLKGIISNMPRLRVLNIGHSQFFDLPSSIRNLKHLRFLSLSNNLLIKSLPVAICELLNLECLYLNGCEQLEELPVEIYKLTRLRYLSFTTCQRSLVDTKFNRLSSLQHLWVESCNRLESLWNSHDIGRLTSLRILAIGYCPKLTNLPNSMKLLVGLEELSISYCEELDLERGKALCGLHNLRSLSIRGMPQLSCLPNGIRSASSSLKYLGIEDCERLTELPDWLQSCPLEGLAIVNCHNLLSLPQGIRHLNSLQSLDILNCPHLSRRCAAPDGEDLSLIRHVPVFWLDGCCLRPNQQ